MGELGSTGREGSALTVLLASRCIVCGWAHMTWPEGKPFTERYVKCVNAACSQKGIRYVVPTLELKPWKGKDE